jgi:hypothetical protein
MTTNDDPPASGPDALRVQEPRPVRSGSDLDKAMTKLVAAAIFLGLTNGAKMEPRSAGELTVELVLSLCVINAAGPTLRTGGNKIKQLLSAITG